jgi:hypothetical protein
VIRILFLKTMTSLRVPQGGDGDHMTISNRQGLVASDEYRHKTAFALAASQNPRQIKSCDTGATTHGLHQN